VWGVCAHCRQLAGIDYCSRDVIAEPLDLYEMLARVKPIIGPNTPVTVPQSWINGENVGGADQLAAIVHEQVEPNPDRGKCSISSSAA